VDGEHITGEDPGQGGIRQPASADASATPTPEASWWPTPVRWTALEIGLILFLAPLCLTLSAEVLHASGFYRWFYGPELLRAARGEGVDETARRLAQYRLALWSGALAFVLQMASVLPGLYLLSGVRPAELGLTTRRLRHNVVAGLVGALILTPGALGLNLLVIALYHLAGVDVQEHPFAELGQLHLRPAEWVLLVVAATVFAPVWEELLFRGLLQPWFATRRWGPHLALFAAFAVALLTRSDRIADALHAGAGELAEQGARGRVALALLTRNGRAVLQECVPALCVLGLLPVYVWIWRRSRTPVGPALFATAVLFAWVHARVWPSPIALTFLALGLGWLAYRTQSLVGPIVTHALFNGTACLLLIVQQFLPAR
jgi:membrane protease YdiL (CAAX protease family)